MPEERWWSSSMDDPEQLSWLETRLDWPGLRSIGMVESRRRIGERESLVPRYRISSLDSDAQRLLQATWSNLWGIENSVHCALDLSFRQDESRVRAGHAAENLAILRHMALNLLRQDRTSKTCIKARR